MKENIPFARTLRKRQTTVEKLLWKKLRNRQLCHFKFRRQVPIGPFIVDFFCYEANLIIELDGGIHALHINHDKKREEYLQKEGYRILRFENHKIVEDIHSVIETIVELLNSTPHLFPLPQGEEEQ